MNQLVTTVTDKRRELRRATHGAVMVRLENPQPFAIHGRLVEVSDQGFRMAHECRSLEVGQVVDFSHSEAVGKARVMWNRITAARVESGFLIVRT